MHCCRYLWDSELGWVSGGAGSGGWARHHSRFCQDWPRRVRRHQQVWVRTAHSLPLTPFPSPAAWGDAWSFGAVDRFALNPPPPRGMLLDVCFHKQKWQPKGGKKLWTGVSSVAIARKLSLSPRQAIAYLDPGRTWVGPKRDNFWLYLHAKGGRAKHSVVRMSIWQPPKSPKTPS